MRDTLIGGGLLAGGALLSTAALIAKNRATRKAREEFKLNVARVNKADLSTEALDSLRGASDNDVNIGRMHEDTQLANMRDAAFYVDDPRYDSYVSGLITRKVPGKGGTVAVGDNAMALPVVAHELGHAENNKRGLLGRRSSGKTIGGIIGGVSAITALGLLFASLARKNRASNAAKWALLAGGVGTGAAIGDFIANQSIYSEEREATDNAMRYLKNMRRSDKQLSGDRAILDSALGEYEAKRNWSPLEALGLATMIGGSTYLINKKLT